MREIKFRAWNKEKKFMHIPNIDTFISLSGSQVQSANCSINNRKDIILMQFTGLKDKNGKEIYEGDIVQDEDLLCKVEFRNGCFVPIDYKTNRCFDDWDDCDFEIIGNIYENPELLEDKKWQRK